MNLYAYESFHGVRRGRMQHRHHVDGVSLEAVGDLAVIKSRDIVQRYVDRGRHQARIKKRTNSAQPSEVCSVIIMLPVLLASLCCPHSEVSNRRIFIGCCYFCRLRSSP